MEASINRIHHVGYLVKNLEKSASAFEKIGFTIVQGGKFDPIQRADILFLTFQGIYIELVEPHKDSEIYPLLKRYHNAPYHICYEVKCLKSAIEDFTAKGCMLFRGPDPAEAISANATVAFLMSGKMGMIELVENGNIENSTGCPETES